MSCAINLQTKVINLLLIKRPSDWKTALEIAQSILGKDYTVEKINDEFSRSNSVIFNKILKSVGYVFGSVSKSSNSEIISKKVSNINTIFTSPTISDLFSTFHIAGNYFKLRLNEFIVESAILNLEGKTKYVNNNVELNNNFKSLKNKLFKNIIEYLNNRGKLLDKDLYYSGDKFIGRLYDPRGNFSLDYDLYKKTLNLLEKVLLEDGKIDIKSDRFIPNLKGDTRKLQDRLKYDAYNAAVILSNFDDIIKKYYSNVIEINTKLFNNFDDNISEKYFLTAKGKNIEYWISEEHSSESAEQLMDDFSISIINSIPRVSRFGEFSGLYLDIKDLYSISALIKNFETKNFNLLNYYKDKGIEEDYKDWTLFSENPEKMLLWYINMINKQNNVNFKNELFSLFKYKVDIFKSLYNFISKTKVKEQNSDYSVHNIIYQTLYNSYGASYTVSDANTGNSTLTEMYSHNSNRVDIQNSLYSYLLDNATNTSMFYVGVDNNIDINKEIENIKKLTESDRDLSTFIKNKLGIYLDPNGISILRDIWENNLSINLHTILKTIRTSEEGSINILDLIIKNEEERSNKNFKNIKSNSEVIETLTNLKTIQDIIDIHLYNYPLRPIMNISTLTGEKIPTYKLANLMYDDSNILNYRKQIEDKKNNKFESLFLKSNFLLGTSTKLEVINENKNKSAFKLNVLENFTVNFQYDFLNSFNPRFSNDLIHVMIGNYSDKNSILAKMININAKYNDKYIIGNKSGKNIMSIEEVKELSRSQMFNYYHDVLDNIFTQYEKLGVKIDYNNVEKNIKNINSYLANFENKDSFLLEINSVRNKGIDVNITEELHYSYYTENKILALNQVIIDNYYISKDKSNYEKLISSSLDSLVKKLKKEKGTILLDGEDITKLEMTKKSPSDKSVVDSIMTNLGINNINDFKTNDNILIKKGNEVNPLLVRWLLINNLFRNEYLFISIKPEYMHPHKSNIEYRGNNIIKSKEHWKQYFKEISLRLPNMSKRNVSLTATYEASNKNTRLGSPKNVNIAVINDSKSRLYTLSGETTNQDIHDGSSIITYPYSKMIEASFPGKSYKGTKKQIATFVTEFGSSLKKDAETVLNSYRMRNSTKSIIKLRFKQEQSLSIKTLPNIENYEHLNMSTPLIFYKLGDYYKVNQFKIINNKLFLNLSKYDFDNNRFVVQGYDDGIEVTTLYDVWKAFGGEYTVNNDFKFNESSNEILYDFITNYNVNGDYPLKENFLHIISNNSAVKSGATNLNPSIFWKENNRLSYTTYDNKYMGPQLDANHVANESKIKEITQVISSLAQNVETAELAEEVYNDIARIIRSSANKYLSKLDKKFNNLHSFYLKLSKNLVHSISTSDEVNLSKSIAETLPNMLPLSSQYMFREFVKDIVTKMNNDFITRYYPGLGVVLNPSHNIIQLFEDKNGNIFTQEDIIKKAFNWYSGLDVKVLGSNEEIIDSYINENFKNKPVTLSEINPGDSVIVNGESYTLDTIEKYYSFKFGEGRELTGKVEKVTSIPRDLKPQEITFSVDNIHKNSFDFDSVKLKFELTKLAKEKEKLLKQGLSGLDLIVELDKIVELNTNYRIIKNFANNFNVGYSEFNKVADLLNAWTQRNLDLLNLNLFLPEVKEDTNFKEYFGKDTLLYTLFLDIKDFYLNKNLSEITDYKFKPAETILPNMYKSVFGTESSISEINSNPDYFKQKLEKEYSEDKTNADLKFNLDNTSVYIIYVNTLPFKKESNSILIEEYDNNTNELEKYRVDNLGNRLYKKPKNSLIVNENGVDKIFIKVGSQVRGTKQTTLFPDLEKSMNDLVRSFKGKIVSIVPLMNNINTSLIQSSIYTSGETVNLNETSFKIFKKYSNYKNKDINFDSTWYDRNRLNIIDTLGKKTYASWKKSLEVLAARIPSQSMQSMMEMRNVAYYETYSNDAFVSVWQIWFQGSDFK